jgi:hypothetical protein
MNTNESKTEEENSKAAESPEILSNHYPRPSDDEVTTENEREDSPEI